MPTNKERVAAADYALQSHCEATASNGTQHLEEDVIDLVANLMHFARANDLDWSSILRVATSHFEQEKR